jgi:beta-carotene hydroxylase
MLLRQFADIRTLLFITCFLGLRVLQISQTLEMPAIGWVLIFSLLTLAHLSIAHNHIHLSLFKSSALQRPVDFLLTFLLLDPIANLRCLHIYNHHRHCDSEEDLMHSRLVPAPWRRFSTLLFPFFALRNVAKHKDSVWKSMPLLRRQKQWELALVYGCLVALMAWQGLAAVLLYWVLPSVAGRWWLAIVNLAQHEGCDATSRYAFARNFVHPWYNWFFFNAGFHTAHHLRPHLHWSKLPQWHEQRVTPYMPAHLNVKSVFSAFFCVYNLDKKT